MLLLGTHITARPGVGQILLPHPPMGYSYHDNDRCSWVWQDLLRSFLEKFRNSLRRFFPSFLIPPRLSSFVSRLRPLRWSSSRRGPCRPSSRHVYLALRLRGSPADKAYNIPQEPQDRRADRRHTVRPVRSNTVKPKKEEEPIWTTTSCTTGWPSWSITTCGSAFSMLKAKFGDSVRSKSDTGQINEALCKVLCHNICVLIHAMYTLNIHPV